MLLDALGHPDTELSREDEMVGVEVPPPPRGKEGVGRDVGVEKSIRMDAVGRGEAVGRLGEGVAPPLPVAPPNGVEEEAREGVEADVGLGKMGVDVDNPPPTPPPPPGVKVGVKVRVEEWEREGKGVVVPLPPPPSLPPGLIDPSALEEVLGKEEVEGRDVVVDTHPPPGV